MRRWCIWKSSQNRTAMTVRAVSMTMKMPMMIQRPPPGIRESPGEPGMNPMETMLLPSSS